MKIEMKRYLVVVITLLLFWTTVEAKSLVGVTKELTDLKGFEIRDTINDNGGGMIVSGAFGRGDDARAAVIGLDNHSNARWVHRYGKNHNSSFGSIALISGSHFLTTLSEFTNHLHFWLASFDDGQLRQQSDIQGNDYLGYYRVFASRNGYIEALSHGNRNPVLVERDRKGQLLWEKVYDMALNIEDVLVADTGYYIVGHETIDTNTPSYGLIMHITCDGQIVWKHRLLQNQLIRSSSVIPGKGIVIAGDHGAIDGKADISNSWGSSFVQCYGNEGLVWQEEVPYGVSKRATIISVFVHKDSVHVLRYTARQYGELSILKFDMNGETMEEKTVAVLPVSTVIDGFLVTTGNKDALLINGLDENGILRTVIMGTDHLE